MTKFEKIRAEHNATKAKWQRARDLAKQHLEERKQMQEIRRSSKEAASAQGDEVPVENLGSTGSKEACEEVESRAPQPMDSLTLSEFKPERRRSSVSSDLSRAPQPMDSLTLSEFKPERRRSSKCSQSTRDSIQSEEHHRLMEHIGDSRRYLWKFGYFRDTQPELSIHVPEHDGSRPWLSSSEDQTYDLQCKLKSTFSRGERMAEWTCQKSLSELRSKLHDHVKKELGTDYKTHFQDTRFAHHGGLPGTTKRLDAWFKTLANVANEGHLKNDLLAVFLDQLQAPVPQVDPQLEQFRKELHVEPVPEVPKVQEPEVQKAPKEVARHIEAEHLVVAL